MITKHQLAVSLIDCNISIQINIASKIASVIVLADIVYILALN
jgi:hypothetical protein